MSRVIPFPGVETGQHIALYTQNHIYSGTVDRKEPFPDVAGIWLKDVSVIPIRSQIHQQDILYLDFVCVLWHQVVALGFPPTLSAKTEQNE